MTTDATAPNNVRRELPMSEKLSYGFFRFADVLVMTMIGRFLILFYTINLKVSPFHIAVAQPLIKLLDVATDPIIGQISDRTNSRMGRRRPYILFGSILLATFFIMIWSPQYLLFWIPNVTPLHFLIVFCVLKFLYYMAHTICVVPYFALGTELSTDYAERTRIQGIRHLVAIPAPLLGVWFYQWVTGGSVFSSEEQGMAVCAVIIGALVIGSASLTVFGVREPAAATVQVQKRPKLKTIEAIKVTLSNKPFLFLVLCAFAYAMVNYFCLIFTPFLIIYGMFDGSRGDFAKLLFQATIITTVVATLLNFAVRHWAPTVSKKAMLVTFMAVGATTPFISLFAFDADAPKLFFLFAVTLVVGYTGIDILALSIIADICDVDELHTGQRREGVLVGIYNGVYKAGQMLSPMVSMLMVGWAGFNADLDQQTPETVQNFRVMLFVCVTVMTLFALLFAVLFPLRRSDVEAAQAELARRREES